MSQRQENSAMLGIKHISYTLPDTVRGNDFLVETNGFDENFLSDKLGISERRIAREDEATSDLATLACEKLFDETGIDPLAIECLVVVTQTPDYTLPHTAALVQDRLKLSKQTASFDISLGCSGYVYGLGIITSFMQANGMKNGILVTAETYSKLMTNNDRATLPIFGDGAAATLIGENPPYEIGRTVYATDGSGAPDLIAKGSGSRMGEREALHMNGRAIFNFMMTEVPISIEDCLKQNDLSFDDVDLWVFHQASKHMLDSLAREIGLDRNKMVVDMQDIGNTTSSTIPIVLARNPLNPEVHKNVILCGFGVGLSWATNLLKART